MDLVRALLGEGALVRQNLLACDAYKGLVRVIRVTAKERLDF
jgi:hypothetical protein